MKESSAPASTAAARACGRYTAALTPGAARTAAALLALTFAAAPLAAQYEAVPQPAAYAIQSVTLVRADGESDEGVTVLVRGGYIEAISGDSRAPAGYKVIRGESLYVYPGLVDAWGEADAEFPDPEIDPDTVVEWSASRRIQGYTPHRRAVRFLTATGESTEDQREAGIVAAAVHPPTDNAFMPGRGALLLFRPDAEYPRGLVLDPELGPTFSFEDPSVYPSTLFGVIAVMRQEFLDARRHEAITTRFAGSDGRSAHPAWDPALEVLRDVMDGSPRVFFHADSDDHIRRAVGLALEFGFRPIIVGGGEAWKVAELLRQHSVPVLVSLDFPEPERWQPEEWPQEEPDAEAQPGAGEEAESGRQELDAAALHEKRRLEDIYANAGRLAEAGVAFALVSGGGEAGLLEGARKAIEYGLSETAALRALTTAPAAILGAPELARIEEGTPATFIVTDGPLFGEDTGIRYTFVEGLAQEIEAGGGPQPGDEPPSVDVTGTWTLTASAEGESQTGTMSVTQDGASFEGSWSSPQGTARIVDGVVSGGEISFTLVYSAGGQSFEGEFTGTVEGDRMEGSGEISFGDQDVSLDWSAERTSGEPQTGFVGPGGAR